MGDTNIHEVTNIVWVTSLGYTSSDLGHDTVVYLFPKAGSTMPASSTVIGTHASKWYKFNSRQAVSAESATLSTLVYNCLQAHFADNKGPAYAVAVDVAGGDDYDAILSSFIEDITDNFFICMVLTRNLTHLTECAAVVAALDPIRYIVGLSNDASLIGDNTAFNAGTAGTAFTNKAYLCLIYDDDATSRNDAVWMSKWLNFDPDVSAAASTLNLEGDVTVPDVDNGGFLNAISHNVNIPGTCGPAPLFVKPGVTLSGTQMVKGMTRYMLHKKIIRTMDAFYVNRAEYGEPISANETDQKILAGMIEAIISDYVRIKRISSYTKELVPIADGDTDMTIVFEIVHDTKLETLNIKMKEA